MYYDVCMADQLSSGSKCEYGAYSAMAVRIEHKHDAYTDRNGHERAVTVVIEALSENEAQAALKNYKYGDVRLVGQVFDYVRTDRKY